MNLVPLSVITVLNYSIYNTIKRYRAQSSTQTKKILHTLCGFLFAIFDDPQLIDTQSKKLSSQNLIMIPRLGVFKYLIQCYCNGWGNLNQK